MLLEISSAQGRKFTLIDKEDFPRVSQYKWYLNKGYAEASIQGITTGLHRFLTNAPPGTVVDHLNGNPLDNRKANLRVTSVQGNALNRKIRKDSSTGISGVTARSNGKYEAQLKMDGKTYYLGQYPNLEEAASAVEIPHLLRRHYLRH